MLATITLTEEQLRQALIAAQQAHHLYEKATGKVDADWPAWYAQYIFAYYPKMEGDDPHALSRMEDEGGPCTT
jgi:hypothetical protein